MALRWALDDTSQRSHLVRAPSISAPAIADTGAIVKDHEKLPMANPGIHDLVDGPAAAAIPLLDYRQARNQIYTRAGHTLVACGIPQLAIERHALVDAVKHAQDSHGDYNFVLLGRTASSVAMHLVEALTGANKRCMAAARLINIFAGQPHHASITLPRFTSQWSLPPSQLPCDGAFAVIDRCLPKEIRQRAGIGGEPASRDGYAAIHDDLATIGIDEARLWQGIEVARLFLIGERATACKLAGLHEATVPSTIDMMAFGHFAYRRTVEWLVSQMNDCGGGGAYVHTATIQFFCAPPITRPVSNAATLDALWDNWINDRLVAEFSRWMVGVEEREYEREGVTVMRKGAEVQNNATAALSYLESTVMTRIESAETARGACETLGASFRVTHSSGDVTYSTVALFDANRDTSTGLFQGLLELSAYMSPMALAGGRGSSVSVSELPRSASRSPRSTRRPRANSMVSSIEMSRSITTPSRPAPAVIGMLRHRLTEFNQVVASLTRSTHTWFFCVARPGELDATGLMGALAMRDTGLGVRMPIETFCDTYRSLAPYGAHGQTITPELIASTMNLDEDQYAVGHRRVFLHHSAAQLLDEHLHRARDLATLRLQAWWRRVHAHHIYIRIRRKVIIVQALVRRRQAMRRYHDVRLRAIRAFNGAPMASQSELDTLKAQRDHYAGMCATLAERGDALLCVVRRAFADEYAWEETAWSASHFTGEFRPYSALVDVIERAISRQQVYSVRVSEISYGAVVALKMLRYAGFTKSAYSALCAATARVHLQPATLAACEALVYAVVMNEGDIVPATLSAAFNRAVDQACGRSVEAMGAQFSQIVARPTDRAAQATFASLAQWLVSSITPEWLREVVVPLVCAKLDTVALDYVMTSNRSDIGARWAMETLLMLENCASAHLEDREASQTFPLLYQVCKACQLGNKELLLDSDVCARVCPTLPAECLARIFALYRVDAATGDMLPHDLHARLLPLGGSSGDRPAIRSASEPADMAAMVACENITPNRLWLECNQRVPDMVARAMAKT